MPSSEFEQEPQQFERLQKVLARAGIGSRRVCEKLIVEQRVTVNGEIPELGEKVEIVIGRSAEMRVVDPKTKIQLTSNLIPYGAVLYIKPGKKVKKGGYVTQGMKGGYESS